MRNTDYFRKKKITIVGLGRSGLACANLLCDIGAQVSITDNQDTELTRLNKSRLKSKDIEVELGRHSEEFIRDRDLVVVSPGVTDESPSVIWARRFNIPVISEIEVGWVLCPATIIAVTGTNGKTTVTTLIAKILEAGGMKAFVCGNIGNPFCGQLERIEASDFVSLEVSSFQLEKIQAFKPKISVILNFSLDHLDRYKDIQKYLEAKKRIFTNQDKSDYLILNRSDPVVRELARETQAQIVYFSKTQELNPNQAAVLAAGSALGIDKELCLDVFHKFKGVEHRLEYVTELNNIEFINDSKSTNVNSTIWALTNIYRPVVLIAGGKDKGSDYNTVLDLVRKKVKRLILVGQAKEKIRDAFSNFLSIDEAPTVEEAVVIAFYRAAAGDCILLSPMCSSFDMFSNFEERGKVFKKAVYDLINEARTYGTK